jgi:hypothetical protein
MTDIETIRASMDAHGVAFTEQIGVTGWMFLSIVSPLRPLASLEVFMFGNTGGYRGYWAR